MPSRLADLIRKARRLAAERDRLIEELAAEWTHALRGQGLSPADLDELWAGLVEDAVRRGRRARSRPCRRGSWSAPGAPGNSPCGRLSRRRASCSTPTWAGRS